MTKNKAIFQILLCSALWSIAGIFMKGIPWSGFVIAGMRSLLAGSLMAVYLRARRMRFVVNKRTIFGGIALCGTMTLFSIANKATTAANAIVLQFTAPIWIMLISSAAYHQKFRRADVIAVALTFFGIALFFAEGLSAGNTTGNLIALASGLTFACYYISLGDCQEQERMSTVEIGHILTFLVGLPFMLTTHPVFSGRSVLYIVILGIFQLGIPYMLLAHASGWCPPLVCSLLGALEPLLNPVWVAIFDGEVPGIMALIGAVIVIATITAWCIHNGKEEAKLRERNTAAKSE